MNETMKLLSWAFERQIPYEKFERMVKVYESDIEYYNNEGFEAVERAVSK